MDLNDPVVPGMTEQPNVDRRGCGTGLALLAAFLGLGIIIGSAFGYLAAILTR